MKYEIEYKPLEKENRSYIKENNPKQRITNWSYQRAVEELILLIHEVKEFAESVRKDQEKYLTFEPIQK